MNNNNEFDKSLRDALYDWSEPIGENLWPAVSNELARRSRIRVFRRICIVGASAAAACLAAVLFLSKDNPVYSIETLSPITAQTTFSVSETSLPDNGNDGAGSSIDIIPSIGTTAVSRQHHDAEIVAQSQSSMMAEQLKSIEDITADAATPQQNTSSFNQKGIQEAPSEVLDILPSDYGDEDENVTEPKRNHSEISLSSNFASSSTGKGIGSMPMYSPSKKGEGASTIIPTPYYVGRGDDLFHFYMPLSFGLQVKVPIAGNLSVGTGLNYTYIVTKYDAVLNNKLYQNTYNQLHYLGIPLNIYYDWAVGKTNLFNLYAFAGGAIEKCVDSRYVFGSEVLHDNVAGFQYSVNAGMGIEYWMIPRMALYFDPSIVFYFDNNQPINIRTAEPLQMHAEVGLRFKL